MEEQHQEDEELFHNLHGVKAVNIEAFEKDFGKAMEAAIESREIQIEERRLEKMRSQIVQLEERIGNSSRLAACRLAKLYDRLDELKAEEMSILERIKEHGKEKVAITMKTEERKEREAVRPVKRDYKDMDESADESIASGNEHEDLTEEVVEDDYEDEHYRRRLKEWTDSNSDIHIESLCKELEMQTFSFGRTQALSEYQIPTSLYERLLGYQQTGVQWLLNLHRYRIGGILGDEMVV